MYIAPSEIVTIFGSLYIRLVLFVGYVLALTTLISKVHIDFNCKCGYQALPLARLSLPSRFFPPALRFNPIPAELIASLLFACLFLPPNPNFSFFDCRLKLVFPLLSPLVNVDEDVFWRLVSLSKAMSNMSDSFSSVGRAPDRSKVVSTEM